MQQVSLSALLFLLQQQQLFFPPHIKYLTKAPTAKMGSITSKNLAMSITLSIASIDTVQAKIATISAIKIKVLGKILLHFIMIWDLLNKLNQQNLFINYFSLT